MTEDVQITPKQRALQAISAKAFYDAIRDGAGKRRAAVVEKDEEDKLLRPFERSKAINLARAGMRNHGGHRGLIKQQRVNIVGPLGKLVLTTSDEGWNKEAGTWFNADWAKAAEFRAGLHWGELLQLVVSQLANEGDMVAIFDDGTVTGDSGSGRILAFESDQIVPIKKGQFRARFPKHYTQEAGLIRDEHSREIGVCVSGERGKTEIDANKAFVLTRDPTESRVDTQWCYVKRQWRLVQGRGTGEILPSVPLLLDNYEILAKELMSAKLASTLAASVVQEKQASLFSNPAFDPNSVANEASSDDGTAFGEENLTPEEITKAQTDGLTAAETTYEKFDKLTGGMFEYLAPGDEIKPFEFNRPNINLKDFLAFTSDLSGQPLGQAHAYAQMRADSSYTSFRGDMVMTWASFKDNQKHLERHFADWVGVQALRWGIATGKIKEGPKDWEGGISWQWPHMPEVDEGKAQDAILKRFKNGLATFKEVFGPNWKEHFDQLATELEYAQGKKIPLAMLQTAAGVVIQQGASSNE